MDNNTILNVTGQMGMYSFYDTKSEEYDTPFFCQSDMFAARHYRMVTDKKDTLLNTFKKDFNLVRLGYFNTITGEYTAQTEILIEGKHQTKKEDE